MFANGSELTLAVVADIACPLFCVRWAFLV